MRDRQPTRTGRVRLTPENGTAPFYAVMEMADEPTDLGTPPTKANLLTDATEAALFGAAADRTVNEALAGIAGKLRLIMDDLSSVTVHLKSTAGNGIGGVLVSGLIDGSGNSVYTDSTGTATGYVGAGPVTLAVSGYLDLDDVSESFTAVKGESYNKTLTTATHNFVRLDSSRSVKFSGNVSRVDHTVVGGGGGGAGTYSFSSGSSYPNYFVSGPGGGGGYCVVTENADFIHHTSYPAAIGKGGAAGPSGGYWEDGGGDGGASSFMGVTANGGKGGAGSTSSGSSGTAGAAGSGNGAGGAAVKSSSSSTSVAGNTGTAGSVYGYSSFTETVRYGGGGGSGAARYSMTSNDGKDGGVGGADFGGKGAGVGGSGTNATDGRGPGGGGGGAGCYSVSKRPQSVPASSGANGCVAIRMHLIAS